MNGRKSSIAGLLIITAGAGAALGLLRVVAAGITPRDLWVAFTQPNNGWSMRYAYALSVELGAWFGGPLLAGLTPACFALSLLHPRPRWRRLVREPGFIACLWATVVVALTLAATIICVWLSVIEYDGRPIVFINSILFCGFFAGASVLGSWVTMKITGTWRPNSSWTDRLGRLTGATWIVHSGLCAGYLCLGIH